MSISSDQSGDIRAENVAQNIYRQGADADTVIDHLLKQVDQLVDDREAERRDREADRRNRELRQNYLDRELDEIRQLMVVSGAILLFLLLTKVVDCVIWLVRGRKA